MNIIQKALQLLYPLRIKFSSLTGLAIEKTMNTEKQKPIVSFYSLQAMANNGEMIPFDKFKGKHVMIVNLASNCGYTGQYAELEKLQQQYKNELVVLGFPANNFGGQEPGTDDEIASFCQVNYGVSFTIFKKNPVRGKAMQPVYEWLTNPLHNGWNKDAPNWNFCKYLINKEGILTHFFSPAVSPLSKDILNAIQ